MTQTVMNAAQRPTLPTQKSLPEGVALSKVWREKPGGPLVKHDHERPVVDETDLPIGTWWMCPEPSCRVGEWVFPRDNGESGRPKKQGCPDHVLRLLPGRTTAEDGDPKQAARNWLSRRMAEKTAAARKAATDAANARIAALRQAGIKDARKLRADLREHVPSASVSLAALVADWTLLEHLDNLEGAALGTCIAVGGMVIAYWTVYLGELVWARRMGYSIKELPRATRARAMSHARWIAAGVLSTGVWLTIGELVGARIDNLRGLLMNVFAAVLIGVVNYNPWAAMVRERQESARAAREAAESSARGEEERIAAVAAERRRRAEEQRAAEEAALAEANRIVSTEDDRITAGKKFADRWVRMIEEAKQSGASPGFDLARTGVVVDQTRKLTSTAGGEEVVIGWEFLVRAEPGVLATRGTLATSPFLTIRPFLSSMLLIDPAKIDLAYEPFRANDNGEEERLINHGVITLSEHFPLGENVKHPGASACYIDDKGVRWGFVGRDLRGQPVHRANYTPGQPGGGNRVGITGSGKSVATQITAYNDLLLGILPIIHDAGKRAMDFVDFLGVIPVGFTNEHRDVIRESLWAEMVRRQEWSNKQKRTGLGGMKVRGTPTWNAELGGPPIRAVWEEFHMHLKDPKFMSYLYSQVRLQRATAIMAETATQGGGLADMGDSTFREQLNEVCSQLMRVSDHTAGLTGYSGGIRPMDLPSLPGMMIMQEFRATAVAFRSAFIDRDDELNPESLIYRMREPDGTEEGRQILFAPALPPETVEVFKRHGLMDLWELGKTDSGRERLLSESDPVQSTAFPDVLAALHAQAAPVTVKPRMLAGDVVLALLRHATENNQPHMLEKDMLASPWWQQVEGEWSKGSGIPSPSTVNRACERFAKGEEPLVVRDGEKQWSLTPAGFARGEHPLSMVQAAGILGPRGKAQAQQAGVDVAALERQAELEAEQLQIIQDSIRDAHAAYNASK